MTPSIPAGLRRRHLLAGVGASLALPAFAQSGWPAKPLRWIVPYTAGGATDLVARTIGDVLGNALGQRVLVDNRPGAGGTVGAQLLAAAPADGYTLATADNGTLFNNWHLFPKLAYTPDSFEYVAMTGRFPLVLAVNGQVPAKTITEWQQWVKRSKDVSYATPGVGSPHHIAMALLEDRLGLRMQHVPYKGDAAAVVDVIGGQVPTMLMGVATARQYLKDERIRFIALTWDARLSSMPGVPTFDEAGVRNFEAYAEQGILMPAGTPRDIVLRVNQEVGKVLATPAVREKLEGIGMYPVTKNPDEFRAYVAKQAATAGDVIRRKGITIG
ncbi:MAG: Bug family tripartite tricarboxylate transporter substrate binding protein [Ramlibacter sp.]